jgi:hypothetical protein
MTKWKRIVGEVVEGYGVASGRSEDSPYPRGSIEMQIPFFLGRGLDLRPYYTATIGVSCRPLTFRVVKPEYTFLDVKWSPDHDSEDFSFSPCRIFFNERAYDALVYYPHPENKIGHFHDRSTLEIIAPFIEGIRYGAVVELELDTEQISIGGIENR